VIYVDADADIRATAPNILDCIDHRNAFFAAQGYSGRINSGVLVLRRCAESIRLLETILGNRDMALPAEDDVGWGENGHVIYFSRQFPLLEIIEQRWNNNTDPELDDYIRHYSAGPMRAHFKVGVSARFAFRCCHYGLAAYTRLVRLVAPRRGALATHLDVLTARTLLKYPIFQRPR